MGSLVVLAVGGLVAWAAVRLAMQRNEARLRSWRRAAAEVALDSIEERERFLGRELRGRSGPLSVRFERFKRGKGPSGTRIEVSGLAHGAFGLSFHREGLGSRLDRLLTGERDIETGDAGFDREVFVSGQPSMARAVLGADARRAVRWLLGGRLSLRDGASVDADVEVANGRITVEITESVFDDPEHPAVSGALLRSLLDAARLLAAPPSLPEAIAATAARDPEPGVRLACLRQLVEGHPHDVSTRRLLVAASEDPSPAVRLEAALGLGRDGFATLVGVARLPDVGDELRARALEALGPDLPLDLAADVLANAPEPARSASAVACVAALGGMGELGVALLSSALSSPDVEIAVGAAKALGNTGPAAEAALVAALADERSAVCLAAAHALGRVGSVDAVPALREAMPPRGELVRSVGRQAIAEIKARLAGAEPGQLSLAGGEAGQLSLADERGQGGEVSLADEAATAEALTPRTRPIVDVDVDEEAEPPRPQRPGTIQGKT